MKKITKKQYWWTKGITTILTLLLILAPIIFFTNQFDEWRFISLLYILLVMPHIFGAIVYQSLSLKEKGKKYSLLIFLLLLSGLIVFLFMLFAEMKSIFYFIMFILIFFLLHAFLNEKTMFEEVYGKISGAISWPYFLVGQAAIMKSMFSESMNLFLFEPIVFFGNFGSNLETNELIIPNFISITVSILLICAILLSTYGSIKESRKNKFTLLNLPLTVILSAIVFLSNNLQFIIIVGFLIIFHVISWMAHYSAIIMNIKKKPSKIGNKIIKRYNWIFWSSNVLFVLILLGGNFVPGIQSIYGLFFSNEQYVLIWSLVHITTSFVNESSIKKLFYKY